MLQDRINRYVGKGYRVVSQTPESAQLVKPKRFSLVWFVVGLLLGLVPGLIYVGWYMRKRDEQVYLYLEGGEVREKGGKWTLGGQLAKAMSH